MSMKTRAFVLCKSRKAPRLSLNFCSVFPIEEQNCSFTSDLASQVNKNVFISLWDRIFTSHHGNIDDPMIDPMHVCRLNTSDLDLAGGHGNLFTSCQKKETYK